MAVILVEGFDTYNSNANTLTAPGTLARWVSTANCSTMAGRWGGRAAWAGSATASYAALPTSYTAGTIGLALYVESTFSSIANLTFAGVSATQPDTGSYIGNTSQISIGLTSDLIVRVQRGATVIATSTYRLPSNSWTYLEMEFVISPTAGAIRVYANGDPTPIINLSGINTQSQATAGYSYLCIAPMYTGNGALGMDDLYLTDTDTRIGEQRVVTSYVDADYSNVGWSPNSGTTLYTQVDETVCDGDTSYIYAGSVSSDATFNVQDLNVTPVAINAVQVGAFARKTDTGYRTIALQYEAPGGTQYDSGNSTLAGTYTRPVYLLATNPNTGSAWTLSDVNNMRIGTKVTT